MAELQRADGTLILGDHSPDARNKIVGKGHSSYVGAIIASRDGYATQDIIGRLYKHNWVPIKYTAQSKGTSIRGEGAKGKTVFNIALSTTPVEAWPHFSSKLLVESDELATPIIRTNKLDPSKIDGVGALTDAAQVIDNHLSVTIKDDLARSGHVAFFGNRAPTSDQVKVIDVRWDHALTYLKVQQELTRSTLHSVGETGERDLDGQIAWREAEIEKLREQPGKESQIKQLEKDIQKLKNIQKKDATSREETPRQRTARMRQEDLRAERAELLEESNKQAKAVRDIEAKISQLQRAYADLGYTDSSGHWVSQDEISTQLFTLEEELRRARLLSDRANQALYAFDEQHPVLPLVPIGIDTAGGRTASTLQSTRTLKASVTGIGKSREDLRDQSLAQRRATLRDSNLTEGERADLEDQMASINEAYNATRPKAGQQYVIGSFEEEYERRLEARRQARSDAAPTEIRLGLKLITPWGIFDAEKGNPLAFDEIGGALAAPSPANTIEVSEMYSIGHFTRHKNYWRPIVPILRTVGHGGGEKKKQPDPPPTGKCKISTPGTPGEEGHDPVDGGTDITPCDKDPLPPLQGNDPIIPGKKHRKPVYTKIPGTSLPTPGNFTKIPALPTRTAPITDLGAEIAARFNASAPGTQAAWNHSGSGFSAIQPIRPYDYSKKLDQRVRLGGGTAAPEAPLIPAGGIALLDPRDFHPNTTYGQALTYLADKLNQAISLVNQVLPFAERALESTGLHLPNQSVLPDAAFYRAGDVIIQDEIPHILTTDPRTKKTQWARISPDWAPGRVVGRGVASEDIFSYFNKGSTKNYKLMPTFGWSQTSKTFLFKNGSVSFQGSLFVTGNDGVNEVEVSDDATATYNLILRKTLGLKFNGAFVGQFSGTLTAAHTWTLPDADVTLGGIVAGSGTAGYIPKFGATAGTLADGPIDDSVTTASTLTFARKAQFGTGLGIVQQLSGPTDQAFDITSAVGRHFYLRSAGVTGATGAGTIGLIGGAAVDGAGGTIDIRPGAASGAGTNGLVYIRDSALNIKIQISAAGVLTLAQPTIADFTLAQHTHEAAGATGGTVSHTALTDKGTNTHAQIDTFIASKAQASGLASLNASSKVVENPANATGTPTASKIPIADESGTLDSWVGYPKGHMEGLGCVWDSATQISVKAGSCRNNADTGDLVLAALTAVPITTNAVLATTTHGLDVVALIATATTHGTTAFEPSASLYSETPMSSTVRSLTGTISSVGTAVTGTSTKFLSECAVNDVIRSATKGASRITAIASDTALTLKAAFPGGNCTAEAATLYENLVVWPDTAQSGDKQRIDTITHAGTACTVTVALTSNGAGRPMQIGNEIASCWYFPWLVTNGTNTIVILSTQRTTPYLASVTAKRRIGSIRNDVNSNLLQVDYSISNNNLLAVIVNCADQTRYLSAGVATSWTPMDVSVGFPPVSIMGFIAVYDVGGAGPTTATYVRRQNSTLAQDLSIQAPGVGLVTQAQGWMALRGGAVEYKLAAGGSTSAVYMDCWAWLECL